MRIKKYIILLLLIVGIYASVDLSYHEFLQSGTCPSIGFLPACYLVLLCFVVPFILQITNTSHWMYYLFTGVAFLLGLVATFMQITDKVDCPKTDTGIPMCYISLGIFSLLIGLKIALAKTQEE